MTEATATASADSYALADAAHCVAVAPDLPYQPRDPQNYRPRIGLIGAGGITFAHLGAYRQAGYDVAAVCEQDIERARSRRDEFFPEAAVTTNVADIVGRDDIGVVDIATHPAARVALIERALDAGKHVLSQKPFVLDLDVGEALVERADRNGVKLAVNQNGRWAPHFGYMREAVRAGIIGDVQSVHLGVHWDHTMDHGHALRGHRRPGLLRLRHSLVRLPGQRHRRSGDQCFRDPRPRRRAAHAPAHAGAGAG